MYLSMQINQHFQVYITKDLSVSHLPLLNLPGVCAMKNITLVIIVILERCRQR